MTALTPVAKLSPSGFAAGQAAKSHNSPLELFSLPALSLSPALTCPELVVSLEGLCLFPTTWTSFSGMCGELA